MSKTAVVTGASRGIGRACAIRLARAGYSIAVNYNSDETKALQTVYDVKSFGREAVAIKADTSNLQEVRTMFRTVNKELGGIDVLVNNAGVVDDAYLLMVKDSSLSRSLDVNIKGYFHCAQEAALKMMSRKSGKIINISSVSSLISIEGQSVYSATKGAVNSMTRVMAKELAPRGIQVNAVAPGFIDTDMMKDIPDDKKAEYLKAIPMGRLGEPEEVAEVVAQLCGESFSYMTGQVIVLDGGLSL